MNIFSFLRTKRALKSPMIDMAILSAVFILCVCSCELHAHDPANDVADPLESLGVVTVSTVANNGMPRDIVPVGNKWNFGPGSLWNFKDWQYAAYWDDAAQVSVARRKLGEESWEVISLSDYQRTATGDRGKGGSISRGFGDGHEKVAMGISPDGHIHLSFDHHLSRLRYRVTSEPVALDPENYVWTEELFSPVQDHLGGESLDTVTYPKFTIAGNTLAMYLRLGGGSGKANSHYFVYADGEWRVNAELESQIIDKTWTGGDGTVNAYLFGLVIHHCRWHITWCWRDTPDSTTCHDLCYAYSDDCGKTWRNNIGEVIGIRGELFITADSPGVSVWDIPIRSGYRNGGSMILDEQGGIHVMAYGGPGIGMQFRRDPVTREWSMQTDQPQGSLVQGEQGYMYLVNTGGVYRSEVSAIGDWTQVLQTSSSLFSQSKLLVEQSQQVVDGKFYSIGQQGKVVRVIEYTLPSLPKEEETMLD